MKLYVSENNKPINENWFSVINNLKDAINTCEKDGCPDFITFDNDSLSYEFAKWIIEKDLNEKFKWLNASFQWNTRDNEIVNRLLTNYFDYRILFKE